MVFIFISYFVFYSLCFLFHKDKDTELGDITSPVFTPGPQEIEMAPGDTSIKVTASIPGCKMVQQKTEESSDQSSEENGVLVMTEPTLVAKLGCSCTTEPIPIGPEGASINNLQPHTKYEVIIGVYDNGTFESNHSQVICTKGEYKCSMRLCNLRENMEAVMALRPLFAQITEDKIIQALGMAVKLNKSLRRPTRNQNKLLDMILDVDRQYRPNEESLKLLEIAEALHDGIEPDTQPPQHVKKIIEKQSSLHADCIPCQHMVHLVSGNVTSTTV